MIPEILHQCSDTGSCACAQPVGTHGRVSLSSEVKQNITLLRFFKKFFLLKGRRRRNWWRGIGKIEGRVRWAKTNDCYCQMQALENGEKNWSPQVCWHFS